MEILILDVQRYDADGAKRLRRATAYSFENIRGLLPSELKMFNIGMVFCVFIALNCCMISTAPEPAELRDTARAHPNDIVKIVDRVATSKGIRPASLLLLELGSVLTQGSFTTHAHLLSLRPANPHGDNIHTILWQALAAPLRIIAVVSEEDISRNIRFFHTDFVQNIRHKFVCAVLTQTEALHRMNPTSYSTFPVPTISVTEKGDLLALCWENRDNLFRQLAMKSIRACDLTARACEFRRLLQVLDLRRPYVDYLYRLRVKCNTTEIEVDYRTSLQRRSTHSNVYVSMSRYNLREDRSTECYSYIPFSAVDVTALVKPFSAEVWYLTLSTVIALTIAYTLIVRKPTPEFSCNILLSIITVRELQSASTLCKNCSGMLIGCVTLAFTFLIGRIYSNSVMSSFLDPTGEFPFNAFDCVDLPHCHYESPLELALTRFALCHVLPNVLARVRRPLRKFVPRDPYIEKFAAFRLLSTEYTPRGGPIPLPLVPSQTSIIWNRILLHGILSPRRLAHTEQNIVSLIRSQSDPIERYREEKFWLGDMERVIAEYAPHEVARFISFDTVREWFDATSLEKIQPLFGVCMVLIIAGICLEMSSAKAVFLMGRSFRTLSSFWSVCVTFVRQA